MASNAFSNNWPDRKQMDGRGGSKTMADIIKAKAFFKNEIEELTGKTAKRCSDFTKKYESKYKEQNIDPAYLDDITLAHHEAAQTHSILRTLLPSFNFDQYEPIKFEKPAKGIILKEISSIGIVQQIAETIKKEYLPLIIAETRDQIKDWNHINFNPSCVSIFLALKYESEHVTIRLEISSQHITDVTYQSIFSDENTDADGIPEATSVNIYFRIVKINKIQTKQDDKSGKKSQWKDCKNEKILSLIDPLKKNCHWILSGRWSTSVVFDIFNNVGYMDSCQKLLTHFLQTSSSVKKNEVKDLDEKYLQNKKNFRKKPDEMKKAVIEDRKNFFVPGKKLMCSNCKDDQIDIYDPQHFRCILEKYRNINIMNKRTLLLMTDPDRYKFEFTDDPMTLDEYKYSDMFVGRCIWIIRLMVAVWFSYVMLRDKVTKKGDGSIDINEFCEFIIEELQWINEYFSINIIIEDVILDLSFGCCLKKNESDNNIYCITDDIPIPQRRESGEFRYVLENHIANDNNSVYSDEETNSVCNDDDNSGGDGYMPLVIAKPPVVQYRNFDNVGYGSNGDISSHESDDNIILNHVFTTPKGPNNDKMEAD
eukprot:152632_1